MAKGHDIRRRIRSVKNTRSITKAMQMVAASKMRKAQEQALKTRNYAEKALEILSHISSKQEAFSHYLLQKPKGKRICVVLFTSNKGLCGSLNGNSIRKLLEYMKDQKNQDSSVSFSFITLGKKGRDMLFRMNQHVIADFSEQGETTNFDALRPLVHTVLEGFKNEEYDAVVLGYTHFVSVLSQKPIIRTLLPLTEHNLEELIDQLSTRALTERTTTKTLHSSDYLFEPSAQEVLQELLPKLVEMQVYQAWLEQYASEQSARMVAMKNATESAGELMEDLTLLYNKTRQAVITQEIAEIVGGAAALS